ncbi:MAG: NfeD family protein [Desulfitobacterium sp.]
MVTSGIVALVILGLSLLFLEIFIPGGILGIVGLILLSAGIFLTADSVLQGVAYVSTMFLIFGVLVALSFRIPRTRRFWQRFSLNTKQSNQEGYVAPTADLENYVGCVGVALSPLRPAGTAEVNGHRLDVVTEGGFIEVNHRVKIIAVEGTRVIVRQIS